MAWYYFFSIAILGHLWMFLCFTGFGADEVGRICNENGGADRWYDGNEDDCGFQLECVPPFARLRAFWGKRAQVQTCVCMWTLAWHKGSALTREGMGRLFNLRGGANITHLVASWRASVPHDAGSAAMLLLRATTDSYRTSRAREQKNGSFLNSLTVQCSSQGK